MYPNHSARQPGCDRDTGFQTVIRFGGCVDLKGSTGVPRVPPVVLLLCNGLHVQAVRFEGLIHDAGGPANKLAGYK